jgi:signal transduction histidine kinase
LTVGPWLIGRLLQSRQVLAAALLARGADLAAERERYAAEAVRYERTRVARELHDIVAHSMSVVVIQAAAGQRLRIDDPTGRGEVLGAITELVRQAEADIGALTRLLSQGPDPAGRLSQEVVDQLLEHAARTGAAIEMTLSGDLDAMDPATSAVLYRVLQEALTNAFKYAPGARISVSLVAGDHESRVAVTNRPAAPGTLALAGHSGGNGLRGLSERVTALGGTLQAARTERGGWQVVAAISAEVISPVASA